jgi:nondiscriminating aspartyl-tRNA synthetase
MKRIQIMGMEYQIGERAILSGWLHRISIQKNISFATLRDGHSTAQAVCVDPRVRRRLGDIPQGSAVELLGTVVENGQITKGCEFLVEAIRYEGSGTCDAFIDISKKALNLHQDLALDHASVVLRRPEIRFRHRLAAESVKLFRSFLDAEGFTEIHTPKLNAGTMEGGSDLFALDYFGRPAFLAQSPQLHKQIMVGIFEKVYETGPVFRAEPHATVRHLNEYTSLDAELGFIRDHRDVMELVNRLIAFMAKRLYELVLDWEERYPLPWPQAPERFPRVPFEEALVIARKAGAKTGETDLSPAAELAIGEWALAEHYSDFVFIEGYPMEKRPFYTHPDPDRPESSRSFDLLFRGQELITGGQRLHTKPAYLEAMKSRDIDAEGFEGYLEAFDAGMPPHGGFAIGLERWIQSLMQLPNIRMASLFPRDGKRLTP